MMPALAKGRVRRRVIDLVDMVMLLSLRCWIFERTIQDTEERGNKKDRIDQSYQLCCENENYIRKFLDTKIGPFECVIGAEFHQPCFPECHMTNLATCLSSVCFSSLHFLLNPISFFLN